MERFRSRNIMVERTIRGECITRDSRIFAAHNPAEIEKRAGFGGVQLVIVPWGYRQQNWRAAEPLATQSCPRMVVTCRSTKSCLKTPRKRRVRARGLQELGETAVRRRPGAPPGGFQNSL